MKRIALLSLFVATFAAAQDQDWVRDWERAQRDRPATVSSVARIAPRSEPGTPLVVHGRVVNGSKPVPNVIVFAYQTDRFGLYNRPLARGWRLRGWARSDAQGRFEFHTIRPGSYPLTSNPEHIHVTVAGPGLARRFTEEIQFTDDPHLRDKSRGLPVTTRNGVQHVSYTIRISDKGRF